MSIDRDALITDVLTILNSADGDIATIRDAGGIEFPGEPFDPPDPSGDPSDKTEWLDLIVAEAGAGGETFGVEMVEGTLEFGVYVEHKAGCDQRGRALCEAIQTLFENQDTSTMQYYPEDSFVSHEGLLDPWWLKRFQLPYQRRETLGVDAMATVNQVLIQSVAHGFSALQWLGRSGGAYVLAGADEAVGIVASVPSVDSFLLQTDGPLTAAHGFADGPLYLHATNDGDAQSAEPLANQRFQRLGYASGSTTLIVRVEPYEGV